jgi:hypothetical protein
MSQAPHKSYGKGMGRYVLCKVVNRKDDPEQSGRLKVRVLGYQDDEGNISDDQLPWARVMGAPGNAQDGGIGGPMTGATENTVVYAFYSDGAQQPIIIGSAGKAGEDQNGEGQLDQQGRKHDLNRHSRDEKTGGGDFRYDNQKQDYAENSITKYGKDESENPWGRKQSKDGDLDPQNHYSIGQDLYA